MKRAFLLLILAFALVTASDDLTPLSDEFDNAASLADWQFNYIVEHWTNPLEVIEIDGASYPGEMFVEPKTTSWYDEFRGPHIYKEVNGDFIFQTAVTWRGISADIPTTRYSLCGPFVRVPRNTTSATWIPGGENYIFLSTGRAENAERNFEVKRTLNSDSVLQITDMPGSGFTVTFQLVRLGDHYVLLRSLPDVDNGAFSVHMRYTNVWPADLNVGLVTYTDWNFIQANYPIDATGAQEFNNGSFPRGTPGPDAGVANPQLRARFHYARYARPVVPTALSGTSPVDMTDMELLTFLGVNAPTYNATDDTNNDDSNNNDDDDGSTSPANVPLVMWSPLLF